MAPEVINLFLGYVNSTPEKPEYPLVPLITLELISKMNILHHWGWVHNDQRQDQKPILV